MTTLEILLDELNDLRDRLDDQLHQTGGDEHLGDALDAVDLAIDRIETYLTAD